MENLPFRTPLRTDTMKLREPTPSSPIVKQLVPVERAEQNARDGSSGVSGVLLEAVLLFEGQWPPREGEGRMRCGG
jgi:hypothetical protein